MEKRKLNVTFCKSGSGSITPRLSIPITDLRDMGITPENRQINYYYNRETKKIELSRTEN